jgi:hypothetical protein
MTTPVIEHNSVGPDTSGRWGDYGAVAADPTDLDVFWAHHEYGESGSWRTWVAQVQLPRLLGDMNCDGAVDNFDITPFVLALNDPTAYGTTYVGCNILHGDVNGDGNVDNFDITPFVALLSGR